MRNRDDRPDQLDLHLILRQAVDNGGIDLDRVEFGRGQIRHRGVAGAEVFDGEQEVAPTPLFAGLRAAVWRDVRTPIGVVVPGAAIAI